MTPVRRVLLAVVLLAFGLAVVLAPWPPVPCVRAAGDVCVEAGR